MNKLKRVLTANLFLVLFLGHFGAIRAPAQTTEKPQQQNPDDQDLINPDRPGIADGSAVIGPRRLQLESGIQAEFRREADTREHTFFIPTLFRIGISSHWEARIEGNTFIKRTEYDNRDVTMHVEGLTPTSFGFKYQIEGSDGIRHPSLGTIFRVFPAWGTNDFRTHHVTGDLRMAADWDFAPKLKLSLNPNGGIGFYEDDRGNVFAAALCAVTLNYQPTRKLNPFIDFGLVAPEEKNGKSALVGDAGVAYMVGRNIELDASMGTGAHGHTPPHPFLAFGFSFRSHGPSHR